MDRSLDQIIDERPAIDRRATPTGPRAGRGPNPPRGPRRDSYPRNGVNKGRREDYASKSRRNEPMNTDSDWVHDKYQEYDRKPMRGPTDPDYSRRAPAEFDDRMQRRAPADYDDRPARRAPAEYDDRMPMRGSTDYYNRNGGSAGGLVGEGAGTMLRIDNLHYELTEVDLRGLFEQMGRLISVEISYDSADRSRGVAFVTFVHYEDACVAVRECDGAHAHGFPISVSLVARGPAVPTRAQHEYTRPARPERSLFDRMDSRPREDSREARGPRRRRERSDSPRERRGTKDRVDRYVPSSRSPPRRGAPRSSSRRPGDRRAGGGRRGGGGGGGGRRARADEEAKPTRAGRPKPTEDQLNAELDDYWAGNANGAAGEDGGGGSALAQPGEDVDMVL